MYKYISNPNKRSSRNCYSSTEIENHRTLKLYFNGGNAHYHFHAELHWTAFIKALICMYYNKQGKNKINIGQQILPGLERTCSFI